MQTILSVNEEEGCDIIHLYPKDIVQLGLDPQTDVEFITELTQLYFRRQIIVRGIHNPQACMTLFCCCQTKKRKNDSAIRI